MQFSQLDLEINGIMPHVMAWTSPASPNWCCYTTLWKSKHRKCNITAGDYQRKMHKMYHSFIKVNQVHHVPKNYLFGVLYSNAYMKRFITSTTCENAWYANVIWLWPGHYRCYEPTIDHWRDRLRCVHAMGGHFEHVLWHECSFIWFCRTFYETVDVLFWIWCM